MHCLVMFGLHFASVVGSIFWCRWNCTFPRGSQKGLIMYKVEFFHHCFQRMSIRRWCWLENATVDTMWTIWNCTISRGRKINFIHFSGGTTLMHNHSIFLTKSKLSFSKGSTPCIQQDFHMDINWHPKKVLPENNSKIENALNTQGFSTMSYAIAIAWCKWCSLCLETLSRWFEWNTDPCRPTKKPSPKRPDKDELLYEHKPNHGFLGGLCYARLHAMPGPLKLEPNTSAGGCRTDLNPSTKRYTFQSEPSSPVSGGTLVTLILIMIWSGTLTSRVPLGKSTHHLKTKPQGRNLSTWTVWPSSILRRMDANLRRTEHRVSLSKPVWHGSDTTGSTAPSRADSDLPQSIVRITKSGKRSNNFKACCHCPPFSHALMVEL